MGTVLDPQTLETTTFLLAFTAIGWNVIVFVLVTKSKILRSRLAQERALLRWMVKAQTRVVVVLTAALLLHSIAYSIRNTYLVNTVLEYNLPFAQELWWLALVQSILFYGVFTLPATVLFIFVWAVAVVNDEREKQLDKVAHEQLDVERRRFSELERRRQRWDG